MECLGWLQESHSRRKDAALWSSGMAASMGCGRGGRCLSSYEITLITRNSFSLWQFLELAERNSSSSEPGLILHPFVWRGHSNILYFYIRIRTNMCMFPSLYLWHENSPCRPARHYPSSRAYSFLSLFLPRSLATNQRKNNADCLFPFILFGDHKTPH